MTATAFLDADERYLPAYDYCPPLMLWPLVLATQTADAARMTGKVSGSWGTSTCDYE